MTSEVMGHRVAVTDDILQRFVGGQLLLDNFNVWSDDEDTRGRILRGEISSISLDPETRELVVEFNWLARMDGGLWFRYDKKQIRRKISSVTAYLAEEYLLCHGYGVIEFTVAGSPRRLDREHVLDEAPD